MEGPEQLPAGQAPLRFLACGSVDDGESTLIGRLLHDCGCVPEDQLDALTRIKGAIDYSHLVDGLEAEREQGITIDVCYRYFRTARRSFIVADTPGHESYTRNMATGASNSDAAVILIDASLGVLTQTRRHAAICSLMGIGPVLAVVNKMDIVDFDQSVFEQVRQEFLAFAGKLGLSDVQVIPAAARLGANVAGQDARLSWFDGPTLLDWLEAVEPVAKNAAGGRLPVQLIIRDGPDFRGQGGTVSRGRLSVGDEVVAALQGDVARIETLRGPDGDRQTVEAGEAVVATLDRHLDVGRGEVLCRPDDRPSVGSAFSARLIWMSDVEGMPGRSYWLRCGMAWRRATISRIQHGVDPTTLEPTPQRTLACNEIALCSLSLSEPMAFDSYRADPVLGSFVLVDRASAQTVAAGMIEAPLSQGQDIRREPTMVDGAARAAVLGHRSLVVWLTGLSGSGKSTVAREVERQLVAQGRLAVVLDGDNLRHGLNRDLGFTAGDRAENIRRAGEVAALMADAGLIVICAFISPYRADRDTVRERFTADSFLEVHVDAPLDVCMARDPKQLYRKAKEGALAGMTGLASPYEVPDAPDLVLHTAAETPEGSAARVMKAIERLLSRT